jgi:hypothetical protein
VSRILILEQSKMKRKNQATRETPKMTKERKEHERKLRIQKEREEILARQEEDRRLMQELGDFAKSIVKVHDKFLTGELDIQELVQQTDYSLLQLCANKPNRIDFPSLVKVRKMIIKMNVVLQHALSTWKDGNTSEKCMSLCNHIAHLEFVFGKWSDSYEQMDCNLVKWQDNA